MVRATKTVSPAWILFLIVGLTAPALASAPSVEICGNGVDDVLQTGGDANGTKGSCPETYMDAIIGDGCDLKCPGVDQDDDGYTSDGSQGTAGKRETDCDDTNRLTFPGVYVSEGSSYKRCEASGKFSAPVATSKTVLCEAKGKGTCKYIDCDSGSDSNAGTYAKPYRTLGKVSKGATGAPAGAFELTAGSVVYLLGGSCSATFNNGTYKVNGELTSSGTPDMPIVVKRYPGSGATITNDDGPGFLVSGNNYLFEDLDVSTKRTSSIIASSFRITGDNVRVSRSYIHDMGGHGDNNDGCVHFEHTSGGTVDHSFFKDCGRAVGNVDNIHSIGWLDDDGTPGECQNHSAKWNSIWYTTFDDREGGDCWRQKHGCTAGDVGPNGHQIQYSSCVNARKGIHWNSSGLRASDLFFYGVPKILYLAESGENTPQEDNELTHSTFIDSSQINWSQPYYSKKTNEHLKLSHLLLRDNDPNYVPGDCEGAIMIDCYGSDAQFDMFNAGKLLTSDHNCFDNQKTSLVFSFFATAESNGGHGPPGPKGKLHSFSSWQSDVGQDENSSDDEIELDQYSRAKNKECRDKGRRYTGG